MKKILLVEDDAVIALSETQVLKKNGFAVVTALCGEKAVEIACTEADIDLILMDIDLGKGMDGTEAARIILSKQDIPIVFLSSHTNPSIVERTESITSYGYVVKNSGETVLIASIKMAFRLFEARVKLAEHERVLMRNEGTLKNRIEEIESSVAAVALEALKRSEAKYRTLYESMMDGYVRVDMDGFFIDCNQAFCAIVGYAQHELSGMRYRDITPEKWHNYEKNIVEQQVFIRGFSDVYEKEYRTKTGSLCPVELRTFLLRDDGGNPSGMWAIVRDITERHLREQMILVQRDLTLALAGTSKLVDILRLSIDALMHISGMDGGGVYLFDDSSGDLVLRYHCGLPERFVEKVMRYAESSTNVRLVQEGRTLYGTYDDFKAALEGMDDDFGITYLLTVPIRHAGRSIGCINLASYSLLEIPRNIRDAIETVSNLIGSSIARALVEESLSRTAHENKALLSELQHRVKNGLAMISSLVELELSGSADPNVQHILERMRNRINSISGLYSMLHDGKNTNIVRLDDYILHIADFLSSLAQGDERIEVITECEPVSLDARRAVPFGLIVNELVTNAFKYAFPGGRAGRIIVRLRRNSDRVILDVEDNGIGLPQGFDPENSRGLGTQLVVMLCGQLNGSLSWKSDKGTMFTACVPFD